LIVGVPEEISKGERRVALVPDQVKVLSGRGHEVLVQQGAGREAGFEDAAYEAAGARIEANAEAVFAAELVLKVQPPTQGAAGHEIDLLASGACYASLLRPLDEPELAERFAKQGVSAFSMELMPRITRAQSMDVLSSQATIAGYQAVLLAAAELPRVFPMLVTAAGTLQPAKVLVIGAGVAGLQALGTAKRLGAVASSYDTRAVVREQVESVGARFIELDLDTGDSEDSGGYAKAQSEEFYEKQRFELGKHIAKSDVVISTALVPGQPAPLLIDEDAVKAMVPGSVIVDLAAEKGGNCACSEADQVVTAHGVKILGYTNLPAQKPAHASQMYAKNLVTFLDHLFDEEGVLQIDLEDEITLGTLVSHQGAVVHPRLKELLGMGGSEGDA